MGEGGVRSDEGGREGGGVMEGGGKESNEGGGGKWCGMMEGGGVHSPGLVVARVRSWALSPVVPSLSLVVVF